MLKLKVNIFKVFKVTLDWRRLLILKYQCYYYVSTLFNLLTTNIILISTFEDLSAYNNRTHQNYHGDMKEKSYRERK